MYIYQRNLYLDPGRDSGDILYRWNGQIENAEKCTAAQRPPTQVKALENQQQIQKTARIH